MFVSYVHPVSGLANVLTLIKECVKHRHLFGDEERLAYECGL